MCRREAGLIAVRRVASRTWYRSQMRFAAAVCVGVLVLGCGRPAAGPTEPSLVAPVEPTRVPTLMEPAHPYVVPVGMDPAMLRQAELAPGDPEVKCRADGPHLRRCLQARANPEVPLSWTLVWDQRYRDEQGDDIEYSEAQLQARRQRIVDRLRADGARDIVQMQSFAWMVSVIATYTVVRGALASPEVQHVEVACADEQGFCACERMRVAQCEDNAFCGAIRARPLRAGAACVGPPVLVGCGRAEVCSDVMSLAFDPTGAPWLFHNSCVPDQPGWRFAAKDQRADWRVTMTGPYCPEP